MRGTEVSHKNVNLLDALDDEETDVRDSVASKASNVSYLPQARQ